MKRLTYLLGVLSGLAGSAILIGCISEWQFPLNRHPLDNPAAVKQAMWGQPKPSAHPTDRTSRIEMPKPIDEEKQEVR